MPSRLIPWAAPLVRETVHDVFGDRGILVGHQQSLSEHLGRASH